MNRVGASLRRGLSCNPAQAQFSLKSTTQASANAVQQRFSSSAPPVAELPPIWFDEGRHPRAKIGYVLLATDQTLPEDAMRLRPEGVGIHFTRVPIPDSITVETLTSVAESLAPASSVLLPDGSLDVVTYACTSGSLVLGEERVFHELKKGQPQAKATSLITGAMRALRTLKVRKLVLCTPYVAGITEAQSAFLTAQGFEVVGVYGMGLEFDSDMVLVPPEYMIEYAAAAAAAHPDADGLFFSCGALRSLDAIEAIEQRIQKPAVCSNQSIIWETLRLAGVPDQFEGFGSLLRDH